MFWQDDIVSETEPFEAFDETKIQVELPPPVSHVCAGLIVVMIIVPPLTKCQQRDKRIVATSLIRLIRPITENMRQGIDRPGNVPDEYRSNKRAPDHEAHSKNKSGIHAAVNKISNKKTNNIIENNMNTINQRSRPCFF